MHPPFRYLYTLMRSPEPSLLQAGQSQLSQPFLTEEMLQSLHHLHGPLLDCLQYVFLSCTKAHISIIPKGRASLGRDRDRALVLCASSTQVFSTDTQARWPAMRWLHAPLPCGEVRNLWLHCSILPTKGPLHNCRDPQVLSERVNYPF